MAKDLFILVGSKVLYPPGHYDLEGARQTIATDQIAHPRRTYRIVRLVESIASKEESKKHVGKHS